MTDRHNWDAENRRIDEIPSVSEKAEAYFEMQRWLICRDTDRMFAWIMAFQWAAAILVAFLISPLSWAGTTSYLHPHVWAATVLGGAIAIVPIWLAWLQPGQVLTRHVAAVSQILMGALFIHLTGGRIETHFHVFASLAFLAFYRDWKVLVTASAVVVLDHLLRGIFWPQSIFGAISAPLWRTVEHAGWVILEDAFLVLFIRQSLQEMRRVGMHEAVLGNQRGALEEEVRSGWDARRASEERFRMLSIGSPLGIFQTDRYGEIVYVNPTWSEISGWSEERTLASGWDAAIHPEDREWAVNTWQMSIENGWDYDNRFRFLRPDGQIRWAHGRARPTFDAGGNLLGYVGTVEDVTDVVEYERQLAIARDLALESSRAKSAFLANMSHEIRTPMNAILGMISVVLDSKLDPEEREHLDTAQHSAEFLLKLLNDVLDFSKLEAGAIQLNEGPFDVEALVRSTMQTMTGPAKAKGLSLECHFASGLPKVLLGDDERLRQVLSHLIENAIKFTHTGRVRVEVLEEASNENGATICFKVQDTGEGIVAAAEKKLFQPFSQADTSDARRHGGIGLGLAISHRVVMLMNGEIGVDSVLGEGSLFWVTVRFARPAQAPEPAFRPTVSSVAATMGIKILVAEDNAVNRKVILLQLRKLGFDADTADNGRQVLDAIERTAYDVILMDCQMPVLDGYAATACIRKAEIESSRPHTPVIALTANALPGERERCLKIGMDDFLTKPLRAPELRAALDRVFHHRKSRPTLQPSAIPQAR